jgi:uridine kinase
MTILSGPLRGMRISYVTPCLLLRLILPDPARHKKIVPGKDNAVAIELISTHVHRQLKERSNRFRQKMAVPRPLSGLDAPLECLDLDVLPQTP